MSSHSQVLLLVFAIICSQGRVVKRQQTNMDIFEELKLIFPEDTNAEIFQSGDVSPESRVNKREPRFISPNLTRECESWVRVEVLEHNKPESARLSELLEADLVSESSQHRKESFARIYADDEWGQESKSGPGSLLQNSWTIIRVLNILVQKIKKDLGKDKISFLDSSCGDMTWMPTFLGNRTDVEFTGYDIVQAIIEGHRKTFEQENWRFEVHDSVVDPLPQFDLVLSRHTMMHLKLKDGSAMLRNFYKSGSHFLLATNFPEVKKNVELHEDRIWRYQKNNLHLHPFNLPPPVCQAAGDAEVPDAYIAFWQLDRLGAVFT